MDKVVVGGAKVLKFRHSTETVDGEKSQGWIR